jgi:thiamine phosphate synthase YjbQ (UPF0047 family)
VRGGAFFLLGVFLLGVGIAIAVIFIDAQAREDIQAAIDRTTAARTWASHEYEQSKDESHAHRN